MFVVASLEAEQMYQTLRINQGLFGGFSGFEAGSERNRGRYTEGVERCFP